MSLLFWLFIVQCEPSKRAKITSAVPEAKTEEIPEGEGQQQPGSEGPKAAESAEEKKPQTLEEIAAAEELRKLDEKVQAIIDQVDAESTDPKLGIPVRAKKLFALRSFICDVLTKEGASTDAGVFIAGDFGFQNVQDGAPRQLLEQPHQLDDALRPIIEKIFTGDCVPYSIDIMRELHSNNMSVCALMPLRKLVQHPRARSLLLTEMVTLSWKAFIVRKLSREFTGQAKRTYEGYRRYVMECLERITSSWDKDGPVFEKNTEYWTKDVKEDIDQLFRPFLPGGDKSCVIEEYESKPDYDIRRTLQLFQILKSFLKHFHVCVTPSAFIELLDGRRTEIPESAIEEIRVPGLFIDSSRPSRKIASEHIMSMVYLDSVDTTLNIRAGSTQRLTVRQQQTSTNVFCLKHIPTDSFSVFPPASSPQKSPLAVVNLLDSETVAVGRTNFAVISSFSITPAASARV